MSSPRRPGGHSLLPTRATPPRRRERILVVEDHAPAAEMVADFLGDEGYDVVAAVELPAAEAALAARRFDLVLCDSLRRSTTGLLTDRWAALERVRDLAGDAPVVLLTAYRPDYFADWRERGFAALLPKPFRLDELLATVRRHLAQAG